MPTMSWTRRPATIFFITIEHDRVVIKFDSTHSGAKVTRVVRDLDDLRVFLLSKADEASVPVGDLVVMLGSAIHFPEEWTSDPKIIAFANSIH